MSTSKRKIEGMPNMCHFKLTLIGLSLLLVPLMAASSESTYDSGPQLSIPNVDNNKLYPLSQILHFELKGAKLPRNLEQFKVERNRKSVKGKIVRRTKTGFDVTGLLQDGMNEMDVYGDELDGTIIFIFDSVGIWAGSQNVVIQLHDSAGQQIAGTTEISFEVEQDGIHWKLENAITAVDGTATISNAPLGRKMNLKAVTPDGRFAAHSFKIGKVNKIKLILAKP